MALNKIFTGMEQGPEKIDANFASINTENIENHKKSSLTYNIPSDPHIPTTGNTTLSFQRVGHIVNLTGRFNIDQGNVTVNIIPVGGIPNGYRPIDTRSFAGVFPGSSHITQYVLTRWTTSGLAVVSPAGNDSGEFYVQYAYYTNDDFPN